MNLADYARAINTTISIFETDASKIQLKSFAALVFASLILYLLPLIILRCRRVDIQITHTLKTGVGLMATSGIWEEVEGIQREIMSLSRLADDIEVNQRRASLESQFENVSNVAEVADELTRLQRLADEIVEFTNGRKFYQLKDVIDVALDEARNFQSRFGQAIPDKILKTFDQGIDALQNSFKLMRQALEGLISIGEFDENSSVENLESWATNLEIFGWELKDNLPFFPPEFFSYVELMYEALVLRSHKKDKNVETKAESYMEQIRIAANFIYDFVKTEREEAMREDKEVLQHLQLLSRKSRSTAYCEDGTSWNTQNQDRNLDESI